MKLQVEVWMISIPFRMQRIIKYKIFEEMTWQQVADRMGRKTTETGLKKEFQRFLKKLKFVTNVTHVTMKDAIVYHERIGNIQDVQISYDLPKV